MDYAVIQTGGKQYKVNKGMVLEVENLGTEPQKSLTFDKVLLVVTDGKVQVGKPYVTDFAVSAKVLENGKGEKIRVSKFRAKSRYRRVTGHRQLITKIEITGIESAKKAVKSKA